MVGKAEARRLGLDWWWHVGRLRIVPLLSALYEIDEYTMWAEIRLELDGISGADCERAF